MIYVTNQAKQELTRLYSEREHNPDDYLRLTDHGDDELGLDLGHKQAEDESLECNGQVILVFEPSLVSRFHDVSVDAYDTPDGPRLIISREEVVQSHPSVTVNWIQFPRLPYSPN